MKLQQNTWGNSPPLLISPKQFIGRALKNVILLLLCLPLGNLHGQISHQKKIVVIDPGHGGVDSGAIGSNGIHEKDVTLKIAQEMVHLSRTLVNDRIDISLTRYRDTFISLSDRARLAKALKSRSIYLFALQPSHGPQGKRH